MPEYLAPGVYVEEVSYRSKSIEGVSTTTTGFVGPTRFGPIDGEPELLTSFTQFERIYGGLDPLIYATEDDFAAANPLVNYLAHGVRAFFDNGGRRLYVARTFRSFGGANESRPEGEAAVAVPEGQAADGHGRALIPAPSAETDQAQQAAINGIAAGNGALASGVNAAIQALQTATAARTLATAIQAEATTALAAANAARTAAQAA
jgi:phage tail sheath protein FI